MSLNRLEGCLLGLACGDAVGATVEFHPRDRFEPLTDMVGGGKFRLRAGEWTDDTSMALCLAESLLHCDGFDPRDQMERYWAWADTGHWSCRPHAFGMGKTIAGALRRYRHSGEPYAGLQTPESSGNGSLMRLAPVPMFYRDDLARAIHYSALSSQTTHASEDCLASCRYLAALLWSALSGEQDKAALLASTGHLVLPETMRRIGEGAFMRKTRDEASGSGYVVDCLEAALWAFFGTDNFRDAVLAAANLGNDADTTAAVCGQLAGAF